jgi:hypothetical protein
LPACPSAVAPTCHRRQGRRVSLSTVVLAGWRLWMETQARGSGSRPWPSVLIPVFAASAWLHGLLGARAHSARVPAAFGDGSEPDHAPRRPRSASQGRVAPAHAWSLPCLHHLLSKAPSGKACAAALAGLDGCQEAVWRRGCGPADDSRLGGWTERWVSDRVAGSRIRPTMASPPTWPLGGVELGRKGAMWVVNLIEEWVGRVAVARPSAGPVPVGGPGGWCSPGSWSAGW